MTDSKDLCDDFVVSSATGVLGGHSSVEYGEPGNFGSEGNARQANQLTHLYGARENARLAVASGSGRVRTIKIRATTFAKKVVSHLLGEQRCGVFILQDGLVKVGAIDIDAHGPHRRNDPVGDAARCVEILSDFEIECFVEHTKSAPGTRVIVFLDEPVPAPDVRKFLQYVRKKAGLPEKTEVFPKQDHEGDGFGNGLWLPYFAPDVEDGRTIIFHGGCALTLEEFLGAASEKGASPEQLKKALTRIEDSDEPVEESSGRSDSGGVFDRILGAVESSDGASRSSKGINVCCPFHDDENPSAVVFFAGGALFCHACGQTWRLREWVDTSVGRAFVGDDLADELMQLGAGKVETAKPKFEVESARDWPHLHDDARIGLLGDILECLEPHTEADPAALIFQLLTAFGNVVGRSPHFVVEGTQHYLNLFCVVVGATSKARKGTSYDRVIALFEEFDDWKNERVKSGLASGEGVVWAVRDEQVVEKRGREEFVEGVYDKRLLTYESEFASVLKVMAREGNTLSPTLRQCWDTGNLRTLTKNTPAVATGAHISLVGHITDLELRRQLRATEVANGFGNRVLWVLAKRSRKLPFGGQPSKDELDGVCVRLREAVEFGRKTSEMGMTEAAIDLNNRCTINFANRTFIGLFGAPRRGAKPVVAEIGRLAGTVRALGSTLIAKAIKYLENRWYELQVFLSNGAVPITSNEIERMLRAPVVARKISLGSRSKRGLLAASVGFSIAGTCQAPSLRRPIPDPELESASSPNPWRAGANGISSFACSTELLVG